MLPPASESGERSAIASRCLQGNGLQTGSLELEVTVGGMPILLRTQDSVFHRLLTERYSDFVSTHHQPQFQFDIELTDAATADPDADVSVTRSGSDWQFQRGDFFAQWNPHAGTGKVRQTANPYAIDSVLRIVHTLLLAREGGFLLHAASAVREGEAHIFTGRSGAGKTTLSRLAPKDVTLLTDEVSYVRKSANGYTAYGTPFAGELAKAGENTSAPLAAVYLLVQGPENRLEPMDEAAAVRTLMRNILFFAQDEASVRSVFKSACEFAAKIPMYKMIFTRSSAAWHLIGAKREAKA
jgi:hypothetical protein